MQIIGLSQVETTQTKAVQQNQCTFNPNIPSHTTPGDFTFQIIKFEQSQTNMNASHIT